MRRRRFLSALAATAGMARQAEAHAMTTPENSSRGTDTFTLFLCGDVMTGCGIDQVLPHPVSPEIYEPYIRSAPGCGSPPRSN